VLEVVEQGSGLLNALSLSLHLLLLQSLHFGEFASCIFFAAHLSIDAGEDIAQLVIGWFFDTANSSGFTASEALPCLKRSLP